MLNFGESLSDLMLEKNIDSKKLAIDLGVTRQSVNNWKTNRTDLSLSYLIMLCKYFNCSLDYLVGRIDKNVKPSNFVLINFAKSVRAVMKSKGKTTYAMQKETRYNGKYFTRWKNGEYPKLNTLINLAKYLGCTLDELVGLN